ncbi:MAG: hypothetical protein ACRENX_00960 [Candidatus Dormibacteria bacterium]
MTAQIRVVASGIDTLHAAVEGVVRQGALAQLVALRDTDTEQARVVQLGEGWPEFLVRSHGWHGFPVWLSSARLEVMTGASAPFPPVFLQWHSAYLHAEGVERAVGAVQSWLADCLIEGQVRLLASRIDLYADFQGWLPRRSDMDHFVSRALRRSEFETLSQSHSAGRRFTGFTFGKGDVVCRLYDKTEEIRTQGKLWMEEVWRGSDESRPVWRLELQFRRGALRRLGVNSLEEAVQGARILWEYGTRWVSLRVEIEDRNRSRWPESEEWALLRRAPLSGGATPLVRGRIGVATTEQLLAGFLGYASALAALSPEDQLEPAMRWLAAISGQHLAHRRLKFQDLVQRKRRLLRPERLFRPAVSPTEQEGLPVTPLTGRTDATARAFG